MKNLIWSALCVLVAFGCDDSTSGNDPERDSGPGGVDMHVEQPLNPVIAIASPAEGAVLTTSPATVSGQVSGTAAGVLPTVTVNGVAATVTGAGSFTAQVALEGGENVLTATVEGASDSVTVIFDGVPPRIDITNPERGRYSEAGQVDLMFTITDDSALADVTLDERAVDSGLAPDFVLDGVPLATGINILQLEATDLAGNSAREHVSMLHGQLGDPSATIAGALRARIGTRAIDGLETFAAEQLEALDLASLLPADQFDFDPLHVRIASIDYARPLEIELTPVPGQLDLNLTIRNVLIEVEIQVGDRPPNVAGLGAGSVVITGAIEPTVVDGKIEVNLVDSTINLNQLEFRFGDVPDFNEDPEEGQSVLEEVVSRALEYLVVEQIPPLIAGFLVGLDTTFETDLLGAQLTIAFIPNLIVVSPTGIAMLVDGRVDLMNPAPGAPTLSGPLSTPTNWDGAPASEDVALAIDDDFLNLLFYQLWRSGALFPTLDQAFFDAGNSQIRIVTGVLGNLLANAYPDVNRTTPMLIDTDLPLPPVARVLKSPDASVRLELGLGDMGIDVRTDDGANRELLEGYASLRLLADVGVVNGEAGLELALNIVETETAFDVATEALRGVVENSIEAPINQLLGSIGGILPGLLGDIPLPAVDFLPIGEIHIDAGAEDPNFLVITIGVR